MAVCTDRKRGIPYFLIKVCEKIDDNIKKEGCHMTVSGGYQNPEWF